MRYFFNSLTKRQHGIFQSCQREKLIDNQYSNDQSKSSWPSLPILDSLSNRFTPTVTLKKTLFVSNCHLLLSNASVLEILEKRFHCQHGFLTPKIYSTNPMVKQSLEDNHHFEIISYPKIPCFDFESHYQRYVDKAWQKIIYHANYYQSDLDNVVIWSDGGTLWNDRAIERLQHELPKHLQSKIVVVEQTRRGIYQTNGHAPKVPVINVAQSAAKRVIESPLIADSICRKLANTLKLEMKNDDRTFGVIGHGYIGRSIIHYLNAGKKKIITYDVDQYLEFEKSATVADDIETLIQEADIILGCSGKNCLNSVNIPLLISKLHGTKTFVSCSSQDVEFQSLKSFLIGYNQNQLNYDPLSTLHYHQHNCNVTLLRAGYPINFDSTAESMTVNQSMLTRALCLGGIIQALIMLERNKISPMVTMLDPQLQAEITKQLLHIPDFKDYITEHIIECVNSPDVLDNIRAQSRGNEVDLPELYSHIPSNVKTYSKT